MNASKKKYILKFTFITIQQFSLGEQSVHYKETNFERHPDISEWVTVLLKAAGELTK